MIPTTVQPGVSILKWSSMTWMIWGVPPLEAWEIDDEQLMKETLGVKAASGGKRWGDSAVQNQFGRIYPVVCYANVVGLILGVAFDFRFPQNLTCDL